MYSFDTKHPVYVHSTIGCKCLKCFTDVVYNKGNPTYEYYQEQYTNPTARTCRCKNVGIIIDDDDTFTVFVEDIRTVHLGSFIYDKDAKYVKTEWWAFSGGFLYTQYVLPPIEYRQKDTKECVVVDDKAPVVRTRNIKVHRNRKYDLDLVDSLEQYNNTESRSYFYDSWNKGANNETR